MILIPVGIHFANPAGYSNMGWTNHQYQHSFNVLGVITIACGLALVVLVPFLRKLISQTV